MMIYWIRKFTSKEVVRAKEKIQIWNCHQIGTFLTPSSIADVAVLICN